MFEYLLPDGTALPENEVIKLAVQKGLTPDDYVKKNKLTLRPKQKKAEVKKEVVKLVTVEKPVVEEVKPVVKEKEPVVSAFPETPGLDILGVKKMASAKPAVKPVESIKPKQKLISIEEAKKQQEDIDTATKVKNVDFLDSLKANFDAGLLTAFQGVQDLPVNATEWAVSLTNPILNVLGQEELAVDNIVKAFKLENPDAKDLSKRIKKANTILQAFNDKNGGDPLAAIQNKNYLGAAKMVAGGTVQALPLMGAALLGGGATGAAAVIAGLSTSMKQTRLREEQPEMELANRVTNAGVTGIMEGFLGQMFAGASGAAVKRIIGETGIKVGSKTVSKGIINSLSTAVEKSPFIGLLGEVAEESTVELGEQLTDMASGIRKELDIKAITNSGIIATGMGGINTTSVYGAKGYMKANEYNQVKKINKEVNNLSQQLSNPLIPDDNKAIISSRIDRLVSENRALVGNSLEKVDALPTTVKTELNDINTTIDDLSVKFDNLQDDTTLTPEVKLAMAKEIRFNAQELQNRKFKIIEGNYINDDFNKLPEDKQNAFKEEAAKVLEEESIKAGKEITTFKPEDINAKALNLYTMDARSTALAKDIEGVKTGIEKLGLGEEVEIQPLEDETDIMNYLGENTDLNIDDIKRYSNNYGVFVPLGDGKEALIINKRLAKEQGVVTTGAHEFLHKLVYKAVKTNPELQKKVGTLLYDHIESYVGKEGFADTAFAKRYNVYKEDFDINQSKINKKIELADSYLSKGYITPKQHTEAITTANNAISKFEGKYLEETLPLLSESLTNGDIKYNETFFTRMGDIIRRVFQNFGLSKVSFETGKDVFDFVRDYNKSFEKGQYTKSFGKLAKEGEYKGAKPTVTGIEGPMVSNIKESRAQIDSLKEELSTLEDEYDEGYGDIEEQDYKVQKSNIERKIQIEEKKLESGIVKPVEEKKVVTEEDEVKEIIKAERGSISSDKVQQLYESKGKEAADEIIRLFKPITKKIVDKRRDAPDFDRELLTDEIETGVGGILDLITKYKPESGVPLAAYINKYLPMRAIATSKRILGKEFTKDVTEEVGLAAEEAVTEAKEKPKYKNVLESKVFEPGELETINNKVLTVIRTLKSRIDAPVSLNRTITPLIAEIRDEIGKQIDIDVKTAMGGKKDGQLKKWMTNNKKYILENMTTTWLMGKDGQGGIPMAVQKQIDGKWTNFPEWVGKKIDRESVSTDLAGRTSGAELVRRLPNVNNNVTNEEFLAQVIGPDGNPLRGRKESLAKAIAEEATFDIINDDLSNEGVIFDALATNQQRLGVELIDNLATEIAKQSERGNIKFSMKPNEIVDKTTKLVEAASIFGIESKEYNNILNSIPEFEKEKFEQTVVYDSIDLIAKLQKLQAGTRGEAYERVILDILKKLNIPNVEIVSKETKGSSPTGKGDVNIKISDSELNVEVKLNNKAQMGSTTINKTDGTFSSYVESPIMQEIFNLLATKEKEFGNYKDAFDEIGIDTKTWPYKITKEQNNIIRNKGLQKALTVSVDTNQKIIEDLYNSKDVHYINIGGNGLFALGEDILNLGVPSLSSKVKLTARIVRGGDFNRIRLFPTLVDFKQKSNYNLDNAESTKKLFTEYKDKLAIRVDDIKFSKAINNEFNKILEENVGVEAEETFSDIVAKRKGAAIGKYRFFVPPSAADLELLTYDFLGFGKTGEKQQEFFNKTLFEPYANGIASIDASKQSIKNDYQALLKAYPKVSKELGKLTPDGDFTYDQALRVSMWYGMKEEIPGLLEKDIKKLNKFVNSDKELSAFKAGLIATGRQGNGWVKPSEYWDSETIVSDLHNITEKLGRKKYLKEFVENSQEMFSKENLNKIETIYGSNFRDALEDVIYRMTNGTNRESGPGRINAAWLNWINNSTGAIMFWNTRSAVLQTIGAINYLNWRDNNPLNAAKAFANQPQYWEDFAYIWNSDKMKERRSGLKEDVSSAEIANAASGTTSKANAVISYLLKKGFLPTQIGDSFAIASGGAAFYRNRINYNLKQGMAEAEAQADAWKEFLKVTDQTQQSGDPRDVSQQQASVAGRLVLAFQNTSMQQARLVKKAGLDLINNRGDAKTNISKIVYYTAVQNIIFGSLQSALFATIFSDDDDEEKKKKKQTTKDKWLDIGNNIVDTILRGSGLAGAVVATLKNVYLKYHDENEKGFKADYGKVLIEAANVAPPLGSKFTKLYGAMRTKEFEKDVIAKRGWDITADGRLNLSPSYSVLGQTVEGATNLPLNRFVTKVNNLSEALDSRNKSWQRIALTIGYNPYIVGAKNEEADIIKAEAKVERKIAGKEKAIETRKINKEKLRNMPPEERRALREKKREDKRKLREKKRNTYK